MSDSEHHWIYSELTGTIAENLIPGTVQACPLIIADDGSVEGVMVGLMFITDLDGLKERAWTITKVDNIDEPTTTELVWAAPGHGRHESS